MCACPLCAARPHPLRPSCWPLQRYAVNADVKAQPQCTPPRQRGGTAESIRRGRPSIWRARAKAWPHSCTHPPRAMHTDPGCIVPAGAMRAAACHPEEACVAGAPARQFAVTRALVPRAAEGWRRRRADTPTALADFIGRRRFARRERKAAAMACHALAAVSTARHQRAEQSGAPPGSRCGALTQYL